MIVQKYATLTVGRNEEKTIATCVENILGQSIPPNHVVLVDDGSADNTFKIMKKYPQCKVIKRRDRGFSALNSFHLYLLADAYNMGLRYLREQKDWDWLLIIPPDCLISESYIQYVLNGMTNIYGVASGSPARHKEFEKYKEGVPTGGGMAINRKVLDYMGGIYPRNNDYEFSVVHCARFLKYEIGRFEAVEYGRERLSGAKESQPFISWGRGMKDGNYHPLYAFGRIFKETVLRQNFNKGIKLLVGYMAQPSHKYPDYSHFLRKHQQHTIRTGINKVLHKLRLL